MTDDLTALEGVGEKYADRLHSLGVESFDDLAAVDVDDVADDIDVSQNRLADWRDRAAERVDEGQADDEGESSEESDDSESSPGGSGPLEVRDTVRTTAAEIIGRELDGIVEISPDGDGWRVQVEVVERPAVPNTQDIMGLYELTLDGSASVQGYERVRRYRRSDTTVD